MKRWRSRRCTTTAAGSYRLRLWTFRVGHVLGVAFVGTLGDHRRLERAQRLAQALEQRIVSVALS